MVAVFSALLVPMRSLENCDIDSFRKPRHHPEALAPAANTLDSPPLTLSKLCPLVRLSALHPALPQGHPLSQAMGTDSLAHRSTGHLW